MKLSEQLYACAQQVWPQVLRHPFVVELASGTLPLETFQYYLLQDYAYLKDYVKIFAVILSKSDSFEEIRFLSEQLSDTIHETVRTHLPYMKRLGIPQEAVQQTTAHLDNAAYTHYMLCEAQTGDVLTGLVALLNCSWEYAYLAEEMVRRFPHAPEHPVYGAWFAGYLSPAYQQTNQALIARIDLLAANITEEQAQMLCHIFLNCCHFELRFWNMAYRRGQCASALSTPSEPEI